MKNIRASSNHIPSWTELDGQAEICQLQSPSIQSRQGQPGNCHGQKHRAQAAVTRPVVPTTIQEVLHLKRSGGCLGRRLRNARSRAQSLDISMENPRQKYAD